MKILVLIFVLVSLSANADKIEIYPDDCGPHALCGEVGIVFSLIPHGTQKNYFAKGNVMEGCPRIVNSSSLIGHEVMYSELYPKSNKPRCNLRKVFILT